MLTVLKFNHAQFICVQVHGSLKMVVYASSFFRVLMVKYPPLALSFLLPFNWMSLLC